MKLNFSSTALEDDIKALREFSEDQNAVVEKYKETSEGPIFESFLSLGGDESCDVLWRTLEAKEEWLIEAAKVGWDEEDGVITFFAFCIC